jgi:hydroxyethylthiazole kinase-like uncharacterized protein yjeF
MSGTGRDAHALEELLAEHPLPDGDGGKDDRGTLVIVGGPPTCPGGPLLAARSALRAGGGRVQLVVHPDVAAAVGVAMPEALVVGWDQSSSMPEAVARHLAGADAVVLGSGQHDYRDDVATAVASTADRARLVLDAGALGCVPALTGRDALVLAPNDDEAAAMAKALGADISLHPRAELAAGLAVRLGAPVAVRGVETVLADPAGTRWQAPDPPSGLGAPGSGDVLIGALGALLAAGLPSVAALGWAIHLHAAAGSALADAAPGGYLASELADELRFAIARGRPSRD